MIYCDGTHLVGTDEAELHQFAEAIGMKRSWFQNHPTHPHYDVMSNAIRKAVFAAGAQPVTPRDIVGLMLKGALCKGSGDIRTEAAAEECGLGDAWAAIKAQRDGRRKAGRAPVRYYVVGRDQQTGKFVRFSSK